MSTSYADFDHGFLAHYTTDKFPFSTSPTTNTRRYMEAKVGPEAVVLNMRRGITDALEWASGLLETQTLSGDEDLQSISNELQRLMAKCDVTQERWSEKLAIVESRKKYYAQLDSGEQHYQNARGKYSRGVRQCSQLKLKLKSALELMLERELVSEEAPIANGAHKIAFAGQDQHDQNQKQPANEPETLHKPCHHLPWAKPGLQRSILKNRNQEIVVLSEIDLYKLRVDDDLTDSSPLHNKIIVTDHTVQRKTHERSFEKAEKKYAKRNGTRHEKPLPEAPEAPMIQQQPLHQVPKIPVAPQIDMVDRMPRVSKTPIVPCVPDVNLLKSSSHRAATDHAVQDTRSVPAAPDVPQRRSLASSDFRNKLRKRRPEQDRGTSHVDQQQRSPDASDLPSKPQIHYNKLMKKNPKF